MTRRPYPFQLQVAKLLQDGRNVILQAPTGAGKTLAAVLPFLDALEHSRDFPRKCIYAVPMRVLANQFVDEYRDLVKRAGRDDRIRVCDHECLHPRRPPAGNQLADFSRESRRSIILNGP